MTGFSYCWRSGPTCSTNLWRQRKQKHKWIARWLNAAFVLFNMSHRQCPWCARSPPHVRESQVKGGWWIQLHDDAMIRNHTWHVSTWEPPCQGEQDDHGRSFSLPLVLLPHVFMQRSATDLTLDKWRWQEGITCSNITSASCASTTALLSLKAGAISLRQADESQSAWLKVCSFIPMKSRANVTPPLLLFFSISKFCFFLLGWSDRFTFIHKVQLCSCIRQRVTRLFRLSCTSRISTLVLLLRRWKAIGVTGKNVCFYVISRRIFTDNFRWQPQKTVWLFWG